MGTALKATHILFRHIVSACPFPWSHNIVLWRASLPARRGVIGLRILSELVYGCNVTLQMLAGLLREYAHIWTLVVGNAALSTTDPAVHCVTVVQRRAGVSK